MALLWGLLLGLSTLVFVGPVFFYLIKSALIDGFKAGASVALGIFIGDIICVLFVFYRFTAFFQSSVNQKWIALVGGVLLFTFGVLNLFKSNIKTETKSTFQQKSLRYYFLNGFLINFINPFVFGVWFGFYSLLVSKLNNENSVLVALGVALLVILTTDLLKSFFAQKLQKNLKPALLKLVFRVFGVIMIGFGARLIFAFFTF